MPFSVSIDVQRAGLAEQYVERLKALSEQTLNEVIVGIKDDIAAHAPKGTGDRRPSWDVPLSQSFYTIPASLVSESTWEGYIASEVPAKARALEYGSGIQGPKMAYYKIEPRNARFLVFEKEGKTLRLPFVMHPGVYGQFYINETLRIWRPILREKFGEAIRLAAEAPAKVYPIGPFRPI